MRTALQDLRYGFRILLKSPGFTIVTVLTLALGIAANTAVFSWIDNILVRPLPGTAPDRQFYSFETTAPNGDFVTTSYADYRDYRDNLKLLAGLTLAQPRAFALGEEDHSERVWGELVAGNYFDVLGVRPILGRTFTPEEAGDKEGAYPVVVIGENLWQRRFQGNPAIIGQSVRLNRQQLMVIGVVPKSFHGTITGLQFEMWAPATMGNALNFMPDWMMKDRKTRSFMGTAWLKPGVTLEQARAEILSVARDLQHSHARTNEGMAATVLPFYKSHFSAQSLLLDPLRILMAVCLVVLLIVCANVANLLLARSSARRKEFSLRIVARRWSWPPDHIRQLITESLLLALVSAAVGVPLAAWMSRSLGLLLPPTDLPLVIENPMNGEILAFSLAVGVLACLVAGVAPALSAVRVDVNEALKEGGRSGSSGAGASRVRGMLVVSEVALALVALIGAGLFARSFQAAREIHPGFDPKGVVVSHLSLHTAGYSVPDRIKFCYNLRERMQNLPGVTAVAYSDIAPLGFDAGPWEDLKVEGYVPSPAENLKIYRNVVSPGFFSLMKIPLLDGRDFNELDTREAEPVMIVSEAFVKRFFEGRNPVGRKVEGWGSWFRVIGVARDTKVHSQSENPIPYFYVPFRQVYRADLAIDFFVRTNGDANQALGLLRQEVRRMDPNVGVFDAMPMEEFISASLFGQRVAASLLAALGAMAIVLAGVGLYSVISYSVVQRTQELGIRMALGASPGDVLALVIRQGMGLTCIGLVAGSAVAVAFARTARGMLIHVSATDPIVFGAAALFLAGIALLASYIPARRAIRIDPNIALRAQ